MLVRLTKNTVDTKASRLICSHQSLCIQGLVDLTMSVLRYVKGVVERYEPLSVDLNGALLRLKLSTESTENVMIVVAEPYGAFPQGVIA